MSSSFINAFGSTRECFARTIVNSSDNETSSSFQCHRKKNPNKEVSIIFCGDFNSTPDCGLYKFMTEGSVDSTAKDWKSNPEEKIDGVSLSHGLKMKSACGTPDYTNYTQLFKDCLDYIYYQTDRLELLGFVPLPSEEDLRMEVAIPSSYYPSDHIALIADLKWKA